MQNLMNVQDLTMHSDNGIDAQQLLTMVNETRKEYGEPPIRNNKFIEKVIDEPDGETYTKSVGQKNGADIAKRHYFDNSQLCFFATYQGSGCNHF